MKERPILFSAEMVRALLSGRKTQTRRLVKDCYLGPKLKLLGLLDFLGGGGSCDHSEDDGLVVSFVKDCDRQDDNGRRYKYTGLLAQSSAVPEDGAEQIPHQYGLPGDRLWVKETHYWDRFEKPPKEKPADFPLDFYYRADGECCEQIPECQCGSEGKPKWRPSIFMRRWMSRLTLEIQTLRVERLQDISEADAEAEGCCVKLNGHDDDFAINCYKKLWESINGAKSWKDNPWVWVIEFQVVSPLSASVPSVAKNLHPPAQSADSRSPISEPPTPSAPHVPIRANS